MSLIGKVGSKPARSTGLDSINEGRKLLWLVLRFLSNKCLYRKCYGESLPQNPLYRKNYKDGHYD